tara:strand:+ start:717 stop:905 length:189 start_codon:yes stop_codon:yes gene_type:complete
LARFVTDLDDGTFALFVEAERRIGDRWKIEEEARFLVNVDPANAVAPFKRDSFFNFQASGFF